MTQQIERTAHLIVISTYVEDRIADRIGIGKLRINIL